MFVSENWVLGIGHRISCRYVRLDRFFVLREQKSIEREYSEPRTSNQPADDDEEEENYYLGGSNNKRAVVKQ